MVELMHDILSGEIMNEDRKLAFINDCYNGSRAKLISVFKSLSECENHFNKDICEISKEDIMPYIKSAIGKSSATISSNISVINKYYKYCVDRNYDGAIPVYITYSDARELRDVRTNYVGSPSMLEETLDNIFPSVDGGEYSNILRCFLWLLYSGVNIEDVNGVRADNVYLDKMYFISNGQKYPIYDEAREVFDFCLNSNTITIKMPRGKYYKERLDVGLLLRSFTVLTPVKLRNGVVKHVKAARESGKCVVELTCQSVYKSGMFYRAYLRDDQSLAIDVNPFDNSTKSPRLGENSSSFYRNRSLKRDYIDWKKVFYQK